jgi:hypothetical protein
MRRVGSWRGRLRASVPAIAVVVGVGIFPAVPALAGLTAVIVTTQQPASAFVGSSITDLATVTGVEPGFVPTGTVTFDLYSSATTQNSSTLLFTDIEALFNAGATSGGYTTGVTGIDYWVDTYSGDSNYNPGISGPTAEPVTITATSPVGVPEPSDLELFSFALSGTGIAAWMRRRRAQQA